MKTTIHEISFKLQQYIASNVRKRVECGLEMNIWKRIKSIKLYDMKVSILEKIHTRTKV